MENLYQLIKISHEHTYHKMSIVASNITKVAAKITNVSKPKFAATISSLPFHAAWKLQTF
jgi:hypothetical protein